MNTVRVDDVVVIRGHADAVQPFPDKPGKNVKFDPIIVRADMVLVDGLRRLKWYQAHGIADIPAIVVSEFMEACDALEPQHAKDPATPYRVWWIVETLREYSEAWGKAHWNGGWDWSGDQPKRLPRKDRKAHRTNPANSAREHLKRAVNMTETNYQPLVRLFRLAAAGDERIRALTEKIRLGELTVGQAYTAYKRPNNLTGTVIREAEQQRIMEHTVQVLSTQMSTLQKLGHPLVVSDEVLDTTIEELRKIRRALGTMLNGLRQIQKERNG